MATTRLRQHVHELFLKLRSERTQWFQYLQSVDTAMNALQLSTKGQPATTRFDNLAAVLETFKGRRQILFDLKAAGADEIATAAGLIITAPIQRRGLETQLFFLHRAFDLTELCVDTIKADLDFGETCITARFEHLKNNYDQVLRWFDKRGDDYDQCMVTLGLHEHIDQAIYYEEVKIEDLEAKFGYFDGDKGVLSAFVRNVDRQVLQFERNLENVGIKVPRQTMITEYMEV